MLMAPLIESDLPACAALLMDAYNGPPWDSQWTLELATRYLSELLQMPRFVGFTLREEGPGAAFVGCTFGHERTWWTADELFVDELYIGPAHQGQGHGTRLLARLEEHCRARGLAGVTLLTNRYMPALGFYHARDYTLAEHVAFLYRVV